MKPERTTIEEVVESDAMEQLNAVLDDVPFRLILRHASVLHLEGMTGLGGASGNASAAGGCATAATDARTLASMRTDSAHAELSA